MKTDHRSKEAKARDELTQEEKRIRIAEHCGWVEVTGTPRQQNTRGEREWRKEGERTPEGWDGHYLGDLPDYFRDLNACADMEETLNGDGRLYDMGILLKKEGAQFSWRATAAQRAEAFGKALNLW